MKRFLLLFIAFCPLVLSAQSLELGILGGASNYEGDLASFAFVPEETHLAGGVFARYNVNKFLSVRAGLTVGRISGDDANSKENNRRRRNLKFFTGITEFALIAEWNIIGFDSYNLDRRFSPYVFIGAGFYKFDPMAEFEGRDIALQPLGTEGQGIDGFGQKYSLTQLSFPMGGGVKFAISENWGLGFEVGFRKTMTDYLDDVSTNYVERDVLISGSGELTANLANRTGEYLGTEPISYPTGTQRGDVTDKDWYIFTGLTISYTFHDISFGGAKYGCPNNF